MPPTLYSPPQGPLRQSRDPDRENCPSLTKLAPFILLLFAISSSRPSTRPGLLQQPQHNVLRRILQGKRFSDFGNADEVDLDRGYHQLALASRQCADEGEPRRPRGAARQRKRSISRSSRSSTRRFR